MNDLQTQISLLEEEMLDRLLTAQLATTSVIQQAQEKLAERFCQLIGELKNAQTPLREAWIADSASSVKSTDLPHSSTPGR